ncbi:MAG: hypothetical protein NT132_03665 [Microbacterium sp.]|uniref:hypothetical protein n=1 Tax=Microbacterium sp. TaxID=51671 RepID=UPI00261637C6|nr:hypothetical protein [Microbacterium sp.]MCX6501495.1 hypothetical protein [Microbacterium sp.]
MSWPAADFAPDADALVSWWVVDALVDALVGTPVEAALAAFVPGWLSGTWPFERVRFGVE